MSIFQNGGGGCFHCNLGHFVYCLFGKVKESKPSKLPSAFQGFECHPKLLLFCMIQNEPAASKPKKPKGP